MRRPLKDPLTGSEWARILPDQVSSVYGPVRSWRVGWSLGIDLICLNSVCSFNCTYCQLGSIQIRVNRRHLFIPTAKVLDDLERSDWKKSDIVTFSGSGEPTLALNLGESIQAIKARIGKPTLVLTNGTLLHLTQVQDELMESDRVYLKLDASDQQTFNRVNRPVAGVSLPRIVAAAVAFRSRYPGYLGIQMMFVHSNQHEVDGFADLLKKIQPDEVQVNTPTRPYPDGWYLASRGSHEGVDYPARGIKRVPQGRLEEIVARLSRLAPGLKIVCVASDRVTE